MLFIIVQLLGIITNVACLPYLIVWLHTYNKSALWTNFSGNTNNYQPQVIIDIYTICNVRKTRAYVTICLFSSDNAAHVAIIFFSRNVNQ